MNSRDTETTTRDRKHKESSRGGEGSSKRPARQEKHNVYPVQDNMNMIVRSIMDTRNTYNRTHNHRRGGRGVERNKNNKRKTKADRGSGQGGESQLGSGNDANAAA